MIIGKNIQQTNGYKAFIPEAFPPEDIQFSHQTTALLEKANLALGKLDGITELLPDLDFFIYMYVRKEAALSSQLEGTQATLADVIRAESNIRSGLPEDVDDIERYIAAMNQGLDRLSEIPLSLRLIKEVHRSLMEGGRSSSHAMPGEFRTTQNWIGGASPATARFVPPPPSTILAALGDLEKFLHGPDELPKLIKTALAHAQFETIHPFVDGNGRTGRLLITFYLCQQEILGKPVLYLSEFFKRNRESYFDLLQAYHDHGRIDEWLKFFLEGVVQVSAEAIQVAREITKIRDRDMQAVAGFGRNSDTGLQLLRHLFQRPIISVRNAQEVTGLSRPNANKLVSKFTEAGVLAVIDDSIEYGRTFVYRDYLDQFYSD